MLAVSVYLQRRMRMLAVYKQKQRSAIASTFYIIIYVLLFYLSLSFCFLARSLLPHLLLSLDPSPRLVHLFMRHNLLFPLALVLAFPPSQLWPIPKLVENLWFRHTVSRCLEISAFEFNSLCAIKFHKVLFVRVCMFVCWMGFALARLHLSLSSPLRVHSICMVG